MMLSDPSIAVWPADWSQFVPDAILTLVTGAVIGWALWRLQTGAESRAEKRVALASWGVARSQVGWAVSDEIDDYRGAESWLGVWDQADFLVKTHSGLAIGEWANAAPENEELRLTKALMIDIPKLRRLAVDLDDLLKEALTREGTMTGAPKAVFLELAWVQLRGLEPKNAIRYPEIERFQDHVNRALAYSDVQEEVREYLALQDRVKETWSKLRKLLTED